MGVIEYLNFYDAGAEPPKEPNGKIGFEAVIDICGLEDVIQKDIGETLKRLSAARRSWHKASSTIHLS